MHPQAGSRWTVADRSGPPQRSAFSFVHPGSSPTLLCIISVQTRVRIKRTRREEWYCRIPSGLQFRVQNCQVCPVGRANRLLILRKRLHRDEIHDFIRRKSRIEKGLHRPLHHLVQDPGGLLGRQADCLSPLRRIDVLFQAGYLPGRECRRQVPACRFFRIHQESNPGFCPSRSGNPRESLHPSL